MDGCFKPDLERPLVIEELAAGTSRVVEDEKGKDIKHWDLSQMKAVVNRIIRHK